MISETKPDCSFHEAQFYMESYSQTFKLDWTECLGRDPIKINTTSLLQAWYRILLSECKLKEKKMAACL